MINRALKRFM